jgi:hypothetical protein
LRWHLHIALIHEFDIENQVRLRWNPGIVCIRPRPSPRTIRKLPRDKQPALASYVHSREPLVESGDHAPEPLGKTDRLALAHLWFAVGVQFGLSIFAHYRHLVVIGRIELVTIGRKPPRVMDLVDLVWLSLGSGADANILIPQAESCSQRAVDWRNSWRQLHTSCRSGARGCCHGPCGSRFLRGCLRDCGYRGCSNRDVPNKPFHCEINAPVL